MGELHPSLPSMHATASELKPWFSLLNPQQKVMSPYGLLLSTVMKTSKLAFKIKE
jgi:hypothetical protein